MHSYVLEPVKAKPGKLPSLPQGAYKLVGQMHMWKDTSKAEHPGAAPEIVRNKELQRGTTPVEGDGASPSR